MENVVILAEHQHASTLYVSILCIVRTIHVRVKQIDCPQFSAEIVVLYIAKYLLWPSHAKKQRPLSTLNYIAYLKAMMAVIFKNTLRVDLC